MIRDDSWLGRGKAQSGAGIAAGSSRSRKGKTEDRHTAAAVLGRRMSIVSSLLERSGRRDGTKRIFNTSTADGRDAAEWPPGSTAARYRRGGIDHGGRRGPESAGEAEDSEAAGSRSGDIIFRIARPAALPRRRTSASTPCSTRSSAASTTRAAASRRPIARSACGATASPSWSATAGTPPRRRPDGRAPTDLPAPQLQPAVRRGPPRQLLRPQLDLPLLLGAEAMRIWRSPTRSSSRRTRGRARTRAAGLRPGRDQPHPPAARLEQMTGRSAAKSSPS